MNYTNYPYASITLWGASWQRFSLSGFSFSASQVQITENRSFRHIRSFLYHAQRWCNLNVAPLHCKALHFPRDLSNKERSFGEGWFGTSPAAGGNAQDRGVGVALLSHPASSTTPQKPWHKAPTAGGSCLGLWFPTRYKKASILCGSPGATNRDCFPFFKLQPTWRVVALLCAASLSSRSKLFSTLGCLQFIL